jgi:hypothetical protein
MVLRILRRVARAWAPEDPASTRVGSEKEICRATNDANKLGRRFYQLISEVGSFRSQGEVHTVFVAKLGFQITERAQLNGLLSSIFIRHFKQTGRHRAASSGDS